VVPKLVRAVTQIKAAIMFYYPQYFAVIAHSIEHHCDFGSALHPEELHITPGGKFTPRLGTTVPLYALAFHSLALTSRCVQYTEYAALCHISSWPDMQLQ